MQGTTGTDAAIAAIPDPVTRRAVQREIAELYGAVERRTRELCGPKHSRRLAGEPYRWGTRPVTINLFHTDYVVELQRVRQGDDEIPFTDLLAEYRPANRVGEMVAELIRSNVTMPRIARAVRSVTGTEPNGVSASSASRAWRTACRADLHRINGQDLQPHRIAVMMLDASHDAGRFAIAALGITAEGRKVALGIREAEQETGDDVAQLLSDLVARGLPADGSVLVVADGGTGIREAVGNVLPLSPFLRCNEHKIRNFTDKLPRKVRRRMRRRAWRAYNITSCRGARQAVQRLARDYERTFPKAAESLMLDLEDSLTLHAIGAPKGLRRALRTTNAIESMFSMMDELTKRVDRWRLEPDNDMFICWHAAGLAEAERSMEPFPGQEHLPELVTILDARAARFRARSEQQAQAEANQHQADERGQQPQEPRRACTPTQQPRNVPTAHGRQVERMPSPRGSRCENRSPVRTRRRSRGSKTHARRGIGARPRQ